MFNVIHAVYFYHAFLLEQTIYSQFKFLKLNALLHIVHIHQLSSQKCLHSYIVSSQNYFM